MMSSLATSSPVSASTLRYRIRGPVFLLIWLKLMFSHSEVAGNRAIGQVTRESRRKPFQLARGAILKLHLYECFQYRRAGPDVESPGQQSGQVSPMDCMTSSIALRQASGVAPGNGCRQASSRALVQGSGSARSFR